MKPIKFKEANKNLIPNEHKGHNVEQMWVYTDGEQCLSCWEMSFTQRLKSLIFGKVWLCVLSGNTQPPIWLKVGSKKEALEGKINKYENTRITRKY